MRLGPAMTLTLKVKKMPIEAFNDAEPTDDDVPEDLETLRSRFGR